MKSTCARVLDPALEHALLSPDGCSQGDSFTVPPYVHFCEVPGGIIFLNLRRDRYIGAGGDSSQALASLLRGANPSLRPPTELLSACHALARKGLLRIGTQTSDRPRDRSPQVTTAAVATAIYSAEPHSIHAKDVINFLCACCAAALALRWCSLEAIVESVRCRKGFASRQGNPSQVERAIDLSGRFRRLRIFAFSAEGHCLFHTLALMNFLRRYELSPTWIVGVKTAPFRAHSWLQQEDFVLDSSPESAGFYTPLLVV